MHLEEKLPLEEINAIYNKQFSMKAHRALVSLEQYYNRGIEHTKLYRCTHWTELDYATFLDRYLYLLDRHIDIANTNYITYHTEDLSDAQLIVELVALLGTYTEVIDLENGYILVQSFCNTINL